MAKWIQRVLMGTALLPTVAAAQTTDGAASATPPQPAASAPQSSGKPAAPTELERVVVTTQRYKQFLQEVPLSVSVLSSEELKSRNVATLDDLQYSVPGLSMYEYGVGQQFIQLRGVSNTLGASTVGTYLDETPLTLDRQGNALNIRLLDMQRVEVLRGPQATLYGEGSMGGTIRYIPNDPKLDSFGGSVEGKYSTTANGSNGYTTTAVLNMPIVKDSVGMRLVANHERVGGWIDSTVTGRKDVNAADVDTFRGTLLARPNDRLTVSLLGLYQKTNQDYQDFGVNRQTTAVVPTYAKDQYSLTQGKVDYDLDFATLTGSASYISRSNTVQADLSWFYVPYLALFGVPPGTVTSVADPVSYKYDVYNAEVRLSSEGRGPFGWTVGASYREIKLGMLSTSVTAPNPAPFTILSTTQDVVPKTMAIYAEANYAFTPKLKLTAGLRYFQERLSQDTQTTSFGVDSADVNAGTFHTLNPRINLSYAASPDSLVYANIAKGFRGGGFNLTSTGGVDSQVPPTYKPDNIWSYELGTKQQLFGNRAFLDASIYRSVWSDVQSYSFAPGNPVVIVSNSGHVEGWGADLSLSARPIKGLTLTGTFSWNNLAFDQATGDKLPGDPVDGAVRRTFSASVDYRHALTNGATGFMRVDYQRAGPAQLTLRNFGQIVQRPGRNLVNLRLGVDVGKYEIALFANNLTDQSAPNIIGPFGVFAENLEQRPRTIGLSARAEF